MKSFLLILVLGGFCLPVLAQHHHPSPTVKPGQPVSLTAGLGKHHHAVSTTNTQAQGLFNQGLTLVYGFNHPEAIRSFKRAAELDPQLAMAYWGIALATGPNYNEATIDSARQRAAYEAIQKATSLMVKAPAYEQAYIEALAKRFSNNSKADSKQLALDYATAMASLAQQYPDDLDAATLYADSKMFLNAWKLWTPDGKPAEGTEETVQVLETVLARDPNHIGANHLYIHAVEASPRPERALASADRLGTLTPAAGHLVHMPAHIYMRVGNYEAAARSNDLAAKADQVYIENTGIRGPYGAGYYSHNLHFLAAAYSMQGRFNDAKKAAAQLETNVSPYLKDMPFLDAFMPTTTFLLVRFRQWEAVLKAPEPDKKLAITNALWHWGRGMAYAAAGKSGNAKKERTIFGAAIKRLPAEALFGANRAADVLKVAEHMLNARIATAEGNRKLAIELLQQAVAAEDALSYSEPPDWYYPPSRESLGGALLLEKQYEEAEKVFRADLKKNRRNGRSLFGLLQSLKAQDKQYAAQLVQREYEEAWRHAEVQLRVEDL
ncbi:hypothetical protein AHMF7605_19680 [Adhaeribacter arboris]|uniref:Uncharacterized protein n=1 Tax=Adhaeribacter arboris TaxID=2072846 RepID=A0A2T2YJ85_9BACT|nr:hypothetical protein [Adhaeribacter arboris]PSR55567.1 hypothetical protein AHMF7605_19680 [Adhaeribacter arboris]